jgi:hypothetical protein
LAALEIDSMHVPEPRQATPSTGDLRLQIARQRRRVDARLRAARRQVDRLRAWRTYVQHFPGKAVIAAFGIGLAATAALRGKRWGRQLGVFLARRAFHKTLRGIWGDLGALWGTLKDQKNRMGADDAQP